MLPVQRVITVLRSSQAVRQSAVLTFGSMLTGVISAVALIYISRVLGPTQFGIFSVGTAIMMIVAKVGDLGLSTIITRQLPKLHNDPASAKEFLGQVSKWKLSLTIVGLALLALIIPFGERLFNYPHPHLLALALIGSVGLILYEYVLLVLSALHQFAWVTALNVIQAALKVITFVALGMLGYATATTVSVFYYAAPFVATLFIASFFAQWFFIRPATASDRMRKEVRKHIIHAGIGMVAMTLIANMDVLFVQKYLSAFETGIYSASMRIALFVNFLAGAIGGVLNNRVARYQTRQLLSSYLKKSISVIALAGVGFITFLPLARYILIFTIGPEFISGLVPMIILVFNAFLALAIIPFISFFYAVNHPKYFSLGGVLQVVVICCGNLLFLPMYGLNAAAWSRVMATLLHLIFTAFFIRYAMKRVKAD